ncbi:unnamed protein product [Penicillium discolor]
MKIALQAAGIAVAPGVTVRRREWDADPDALRARAADFGLPVFVKPARAGSSVGVSKVSAPEELDAALAIAFAEDDKVLIEAGVSGREIEVAVLETADGVRASLPGEIVLTDRGFYDFEGKYLGGDGVDVVCPAELTEAEVAAVQEAGVRAFQAVDGRGLARVDMFLTPTGELVVNELNTMPGFTPISMFPKRACAADGVVPRACSARGELHPVGALRGRRGQPRLDVRRQAVDDRLEVDLLAAADDHLDGRFATVGDEALALLLLLQDEPVDAAEGGADEIGRGGRLHAASQDDRGVSPGARGLRVGPHALVPADGVRQEHGDVRAGRVVRVGRRLEVHGRGASGESGGEGDRPRDGSEAAGTKHVSRLPLTTCPPDPTPTIRAWEISRRGASSAPSSSAPRRARTRSSVPGTMPP